MLPIVYCFLLNAFCDLKLQKRLPLLLPIPFLLCQLTYAELLNWAMASLSALAVVCFSLLSFHFLVRHTRFGLLFACAALAIACSAATNGFFVIPIGAILLGAQRRRHALTIWSVLSGVLALLYTIGYHRVAHSPGLPLWERGGFFLSFAGVPSKTCTALRFAELRWCSVLACC